MLEQTFLHIPGVGHMSEQSLWNQGCERWSDFLANPAKFSCGQVDSDTARKVLEKSQIALSEGRAQFFRYGLGQKEAWRAFPDFRHRCVYLDIETDGGQSGDAVTVIGLYDGKEFKCLVKGHDLDDFPDVIAQYGIIVTFFGTGFDLPMLQKCFRGLRFDQLHIDLCPTMRRLGYRGGLKKIEKTVGISRGGNTEGLNGLDAIKLWRRYAFLGDDAALEKLIAYNREDVVNMERLAEIAYDGLRVQTFLGNASPI